MPPLTAYITTKEACDILRVDRATIGRWMDSGKLTPVHKLPGLTGAFLFRRSDVERIAKKRQSA